MWLLPLLSTLSGLAARVYYRFATSGEEIPHSGPVLLLANHPNLLLDSALVAAAADRPVRFLAKSTLFEQRWTGWLFRAAGAIPVYRRMDDPAQSGRNVETFQAVEAGLHADSAVGIFPEGLSHGEPSMARLKTGSARIALGFAERHGRTFPIVPVGLILRDRSVFRSEAYALRGEPVTWDDLAGRGAEDREAVLELTERIDAALRRVTANLETWRDLPLVLCVEAIWTAAAGNDDDPGARVERARVTSETLSRLRSGPDPQWRDLARRVSAYCRRLRRLNLSPTDLEARVDLSTALSWIVRRLYLLPGLALAVASSVLLWVPYRLTGWLADRVAPDTLLRATYRVGVGVVLYTLWVLALALLAGLSAGIATGLAVALGLPVIGVLGRRIAECWNGAWSDARRFFLLRAHADLIRSLRDEQQEIANYLLRFYETLPDEPA